MRLPSVARPLLRLLLGLALCLAAATGRAQAPDRQVLTQALFADSAEGPWQEVALPDTWARRGLARSGRGVYRLGLELERVPDTLWVLRLQRLSTYHRIRVNGQLVSGSMRDDGSLPGEHRVHRRPVPALVNLPPALLRAGANEIVIEVNNGVRAGLSAVEAGPAEAIEAEFITGYYLHATLPQLLNVASGGVCLLVLLLWWRRRSEAALGTFAVLGLLTSVRNYGYYSVDTAWPAMLTDWLYFAAQVCSVMLLGLFAMALSGRRPRGFREALLWGGAALLAAGAVAVGAGQLNLARIVAYPALLTLALPALWLIARRARELRAAALAGLVVGLVLVLGAGVHDYLYQQGRTSVMDAYWLPYAVPVALVAFAGVLVQRMVSAMRQVEELNQTLELRVRERTHDLHVANQAKTRFLAAASHDLRQPVVTIGLLVGLLREQVAEPALRAMVARVDEAVASMEALLAGLLDLSRLDAGTVRPRLRTVPLQPLFEAIAAHEGEAARRKGLALRVRPTPLAVQADPLLLEQVLRNFVGNAVRYTDAGGVLIAARRRGPRVLVQVWDTGRGIPPSQREAVFEEFVQLDNPQRDRSQGLGLGLAIVRRGAALMQAPLSLASREGRGACFGIALPLADGGAATLPQDVRPEPLLVGQTVVLVEDDAAVREAMTARLSAWGAQVQAHASPHALRTALDALPPSERRAALLITDQRLPGGSGLDVVALVRRRYGMLPALIVTGNTSPREIARLTASGLRVLHKPFRAEELLAAIRAVMAAA